MPPIDIEEDAIPILEAHYVARIRHLTDKTHIPKMCKPTERKLLSYVPMRLRKKYPNIVSKYMTDVHADYDKIMKAYSIQKILKPAPGDYIPPRISFAFQHLGQTDRYNVYLQNRAKLAKFLLIAYPFIRSILNYSKTDFPVILNDYGAYRVDDRGKKLLLNLVDFGKLVAKDLEENALFLKKGWYPKIVRIMKKYYGRHVVPPRLWPRIFTCAKGLINRQITDLKIQTFQHINDVLLRPTLVPYLKLELVCRTNTIDLCPTFKEIYETYRCIFNDIAKVGQYLPLLELQIDSKEFEVNSDCNYMKVEIETRYMKEAYERLHETLRQAYAPLLDYVDDFRTQYYGLFGNETRIELTSFLATPQSFEDYLAKIDVFNVFIDALRCQAQNEFFDMATVHQTKAITGLRIIAQDYILEITKNIVAAHRNDCAAICDLFKVIRDHAIEVPTTTEMLLANGEYMLEAKTKEMLVLQGRIQENLRVKLKMSIMKMFLTFLFIDWWTTDRVN